MARILFEFLLPIVLPTALYAAWLAWHRRRAIVAGAARVPAWQEGPWFWCILAGVGLALIVFVVTAVLWGHAPGAKYQPPRIHNGEVIPGQFQD